MAEPLLSVSNLTVEFTIRGGVVPVIDDLSFDLGPGETLSLVGESGCGKSMTALAILGLIPSPPGVISAGSITLQGEDLVQTTDARMREIRGNEVSMVFQEPMTSLNPVYTVGEQSAGSVSGDVAASRQFAHQLCRPDSGTSWVLEKPSKLRCP
jgi:ABC-type dipeptide/oligopeptide/nickel transport system ATPase component